VPTPPMKIPIAAREERAVEREFGVDALRKARAVCRSCGRKGVGYARHANAYGWKDYSKASCRYCNALFHIG
jgi:hypothetical protein